jgi:uncharacterized ferritin-like protein (DUF455 family)
MNAVQREGYSSDDVLFEVQSNGRLERFARALHELWWFERCSAHILSGWIPKFPQFALKVAGARLLYESMSIAYQLRRAIAAIEPVEKLDLSVPQGWFDLMIDIDRRSGSAADVLHLIIFGVKARLIELYRRTLADADDILNAPVIELLATSGSKAQAAIHSTAEMLGRESNSFSSGPCMDPFERSWRERNKDRNIVSAELWRPLDRVTEAVRPSGLDRGIAGALRPVPFDAYMDPKGIGVILHNNINGEYTTMELVARCSYEHPDMPAAFHLDMARHASDEARHALAFERLAASYGVRYGDYAVYTYTYDALYQFDGLLAGSRDELLWRLLLRATVQEGVSLDDLAYQAKRRAFHGQHEMAFVFSQILADEIFHVQGGLKWTRYLCSQLDRNTVEERERAKDYYELGLARRRLRFLENHPVEARTEAAHVRELQTRRAERKEQIPFQPGLNTVGRRRAGFTEEEIEQAAVWEAANFRSPRSVP